MPAQLSEPSAENYAGSPADPKELVKLLRALDGQQGDFYAIAKHLEKANQRLLGQRAEHPEEPAAKTPSLETDGFVAVFQHIIDKNDRIINSLFAEIESLNSLI